LPADAVLSGLALGRELQKWRDESRFDDGVEEDDSRSTDSFSLQKWVLDFLQLAVENGQETSFVDLLKHYRHAREALDCTVPQHVSV
jgi:hypothetical protein